MERVAEKQRVDLVEDSSAYLGHGQPVVAVRVRRVEESRGEVGKRKGNAFAELLWDEKMSGVGVVGKQTKKKVNRWNTDLKGGRWRGKAFDCC